MDPIAQAISRIIKEQEAIIGPVALDQAKKISGISAVSVDEIKIHGDGKEILEHLVSRYEKFFGKASVEVCKEAIEPIRDQLPQTQLPDILKN